MASLTAQLRSRKWERRDGYFISTDDSLIPVAELIEVFDRKEFYWAKPMPHDAMREMLRSSLCFGLYGTNHDSTASNGQHPDSAAPQQNKFVGIARLVTDFTTFAYLTDVWVNPALQGQGLGTWLIKCVQEVLEDMPYLRRSMLFTSDWERSVPFYEKLMDMTILETQIGAGNAIMQCKGKGHPTYGTKADRYDMSSLT